MTYIFTNIVSYILNTTANNKLKYNINIFVQLLQLGLKYLFLFLFLKTSVPHQQYNLNITKITTDYCVL